METPRADAQTDPSGHATGTSPSAGAGTSAGIHVPNKSWGNGVASEEGSLRITPESMGVPIVQWDKPKGERVKLLPTTSQNQRHPLQRKDKPARKDAQSVRPSEEHMDWRQSVGAACILPLLRHLHAANPARSSTLDTVTSREQRQVWTCGQNSYGELGHDDTGTRKSYCLLRAFNGEEVIDVAAGELQVCGHGLIAAHRAGRQSPWCAGRHVATTVSTWH